MTTSTDGSARPRSGVGPGPEDPPPGPVRSGPAPASGLIGGRYRLGELIGVGGTASVFAAEDLGAPGPGRAVAVKIAHSRLSADDVAREAFLGPARAVAALRHPNLVAVRDLGVHDAGGQRLAWIASDLVPGPSLARRIAEGGPLAVPDAVAVAEGVLAGLAAVHAAGLVHRDVSPGNVLLEPGPGPGRARLTDFGLVDAPGRPTTADPDSVAGSVHVMSPEQARGRPVDARGDLYQAGALLYVALTGRPPFPRPTVEQVMAAHVQAPPPVPSAVVGGVPLALDRVVTRAMAKDPDRRFGSATAMAEALRRAVPLRPGGDPAEGVPPAPAEPAGDGRPGGRPLARTAEVPVLGPSPPGPTGATDRALAGALAPEPVPARSGAGAIALFAALLTGVLLWAWAPWTVDDPGDAAAAPVVITLSPTTSPAPPPPVESGPEPPPEPAPIVVPELTGLLDDVRPVLEAVGLAVGEVTQVTSAAPAGTVLSVAPAPGSPVAPGTAVDLEVASGFNAVPAVTDLGDTEAQTELESAGFVAARLFVTDPSAPPGAVTGTRPATGAVRAVGSTVWLLVNQTEPPSPDPDPAPTEDPTPDPTPTGTPDPAPEPEPDPTQTPTETPTESPTETPTDPPDTTAAPARANGRAPVGRHAESRRRRVTVGRGLALGLTEC